MKDDSGQPSGIAAMSLTRRRLKPDINISSINTSAQVSGPSTVFNQTVPQKLSNQTQQTTVNAALQAQNTANSIPPLTQNGIISFENADPFTHLDSIDPCSLLASNDDPKDSQESGIAGLDWTEIDPALLANCTSRPSSAPSYVIPGAGHDGGSKTNMIGDTSIVCDEASKGPSPHAPVIGSAQQSVSVTYVYKMETANASSVSSLLPKLEGNILNELSNLCKTSHEYSVVSIESAPDDVEITTGSCNVESANADDCFVIDGALTLYLHGASNSSAAEEAARESIINAMDNDDLLDSNNIPEVIEVQYLGKTYNEYISGSQMISIECPNAPVNVSATADEVLLTYIYEVETANASSSSTFLKMLEEKILKQLLHFCEASERYSLVGIMSTPEDVEIATGRCTIESSSANNCFVIDGALTLKVDSSSNSTAAEESVRESIITAMENDDLLDSTAMPEVIKVQYLNKTYGDYIRGNTATSISCDTLNSNAPFIFTTDTAAQVKVTYVYEVETANTSSTSSFLPVLEENILMELSDMCEMLAIYGVVAIMSTPDDVEMKTGPCTIESPAADNCFVFDGAFTLELSSSPNSTAAADASLSIVKHAMYNDDLLNSTTIPEVIKVRYLNKTYDDYMGGFTSEEGSIAVVGTGGGGTVVGESSDKESSKIGALIGSFVALVCLILFALLLLRMRRRRKQLREAQEEEWRRQQEQIAQEMEREFDGELDDLVADIDGATTSRQFNSSVDPPGHFHLGNHHYTADGVRYYSPNCAQCASAKANGALNPRQNQLEEKEDHSFDDLSFDLNAAKKFTDFSIHDLGKHHSSIHVRQCKSKTCQGCRNDLAKVVFIQSTQSAPKKTGKKQVLL
ncbi:hypothetical protein HJC23_006343 [Cyclotella cryptica]|uniref:Uncharacterized protein n=1 Tax=Cyclotella cryptica TaxID=29204 RepID=A0ABD3Q4N8_9STRA